MTPASSTSLSLQSADTHKVRPALEDLGLSFARCSGNGEGLSYKQIADVVDIPMGTVMSRLARARKRLQESLASRGNKETSGELLAVGAI
ncbi:MAG: Sigma-70, region 4 [Blastocatellia bacterium]|jgi:RNA polymerase sigma-70 factor (ECF subfamily)|nr:Sigma-70, region 4 [Blastocatellia bacterium]